MRLRWVVLLVTLVLGSAISAFASSPDLGVLDPSCNQNSGLTNVDKSFVGPGNVVTLPGVTSVNGGGTFTFCNLTQLYWTQVDFNTSNFGGFGTGSFTFTGGANDPTNAPVACSAGFNTTDQTFQQCIVTITSTNIMIEFSGVDGTPSQGNNIFGIRNNHTMTVTLNTGFCETGVNGCGNGGDWKTANGSPITLSGSANGVSVPEPATLGLLSAGCALWLRRRKRT